MKNILFVCSQNRLRSPTAEQVFARRDDIEVASAGTNHDAETPLSAELVAWADIIFVMEKTHRAKVRKRFRAALNGARLICLDIPDDYAFMDPDLVRCSKQSSRVSCRTSRDGSAGDAGQLGNWTGISTFTACC